MDVQTGGRITLKEVAARAEVSLATASKVMNGRSDVREETRERVTGVARQLGYSPKRRNPPLRHRVVIVFRDLTSPYALQVMDGAAHAAARADVDLVVSFSGHQPDEGPAVLSREWIRDQAAAGASGVIAVTWPVEEEHARWSARYQLPMIAIDPASTSTEDQLVTISATNWEGGSSAVQHLIDLGHRRIGVVAGPDSSVPARQRVQGYRSVLQQEGIPYDPVLVHVGTSYSFDAGWAGATALLTLEDRPTAIFAVADTLAMGVLRVARDMGISVPEELSVVSFDDTPIATWANPQLTAIRQPLFSMGQVAVERLLAIASDTGKFARPFKLETSLVVRESTAPPAGDLSSCSPSSSSMGDRDALAERRSPTMGHRW